MHRANQKKTLVYIIYYDLRAQSYPRSDADTTKMSRNSESSHANDGWSGMKKWRVSDDREPHIASRSNKGIPKDIRILLVEDNEVNRKVYSAGFSSRTNADFHSLSHHRLVTCIDSFFRSELDC